MKLDASKCKDNKCTCVICPKCGVHEVHPDGDKVCIRANKVTDEKGDWSQCLVCAGFYDEKLVYQPEKGDKKGGWFRA